MAPPLPQRPSEDQRLPSMAVGCMSMLLVGVVVLVAVVGLMLLSSGLLTYALLAGAAFFAYALFHYVVWGWWLAGMIRQDAQREEQEHAERIGAGD